MVSSENDILVKILEKLNILIIPKNIAIFNDKGQIIELYLSRFGLKEIPLSFFDNSFFENIEKLFLNSNKITNLPENVFEPLKNLKYLNLSRNFIAKIDTRPFKNLSNLVELDLSNNNISNIENHSFDLPELTKLKLKNNRLKDLPDDIFTNLVKIEQLDLSINKFRKVPIACRVLLTKKLQFLDLKGNLIPTDFAKTFKTVPVIHSFLNEINTYWLEHVESIDILDLEKIIKQYLFDALMSVYHYSINIPVLNYSILNLTLGYMSKNFHLLSSYISTTKKELTFRETIWVWEKCLTIFLPESLIRLLENEEDSSERKRRVLERKQKLLTELEVEALESGGIMDYKFKKSSLEELELEPVHEHLFSIIKKFMTWNTQEFSTIFL
jgi:hypothetical protein